MFLKLQCILGGLPRFYRRLQAVALMTMCSATDTVVKYLPGLRMVLKRSDIEQAKVPVSITKLSHANPKAFQTNITDRKWTRYLTCITKTIRDTSPEEEKDGALSLHHYALKSGGFQQEKSLK